MSDGTTSEQKKEDWMNSKWRPAMVWMYMSVCTCDFIIFPILWAILHATLHTANMVQWNPLTLQGAGLFHLAMGAVLGITAFGRTQEKLNGVNDGGIQTPTTGSSSGSSAFGAPSAGFGAPTSSFGSSAPNTAPTGVGYIAPSMAAPAGGVRSTAGVTAGFSGKKAPIPQDDPVL